MRLNLFNKIAAILLVLVLGSVFAAFTAPSAFAQETCPGSLPARLIVGQGGRVKPGGANNVRLNPTTNADRIGEIPSGETAVILEGPICADGYTWWKVDYNGLNGWTPEGGDGEYWLEVIDLATGHPPIVIAEGDCEGSLPRRLIVGNQGRVRPRIPNNVRLAPGLYGDILGEIPAEDTFTVLDGPVCGDGYTWWQVDYKGLIGWTAESGDGEYWLQMLDAPTVTPSATATLQPATATHPATATPTAEDSLLYTVPDEFKHIGIIPVWTETFDTFGPLSTEAANAVGVYVNPIMDYGVSEGTLVLAHEGMIKPIEWERVIDTTVTEPMNQFAVSVDIQNLRPGDVYACAVIEINADAPHNAIATFCRNGFMSLYYPGTPQTGSWEGRAPNAMDGMPHRLTLIADGTHLRLYSDGVGGVSRPYTGTLESIGLTIEHSASSAKTISDLRFDNLQIGIPTNTLPPRPAITVTRSPVNTTPPPPTSTGSVTPASQPTRELLYTVPPTFEEVQVVLLWKTNFDKKAKNLDTDMPTVTVYTDVWLDQSFEDGALSLSYSGSVELGDDLTRVAHSTIEESTYQYILSVDTQNFSPDTSDVCAVLSINPQHNDGATALFCKEGLIRILLAGEPVAEWQDPAYDAMDGQPHRLSLIADGVHLRPSVDGHGTLAVPYQEHLSYMALSLYNPTADAETESRLQFDNLEIGLPLTCAIAITLSIDEVKAGYADVIFGDEYRDVDHVDFRYGVHFSLFDHYDATDVLWSLEMDFHVVDGTRLFNFPPITRVMPCDEATRVNVSITDPEEYLSSDRAEHVVSANDLVSYPQTLTKTFTYRGNPFEYEITYTIDVQSVGSDVALPDPADLENIGIDYGNEEGDE